MKKSICYVLLILLMPICFLVGCSNEEPTNINLTTNNYSEYISFNVVYEDVYFNNDSMFCVAKITTSPKASNIEFKDCNIKLTLSYKVADGWIVNNESSFAFVSLSYDGYSESSITIFKILTPNSSTMSPSSNIENIKLESISGQVIAK